MGARDVGLFDARLQHPFSMIVSGPSNSGKTYFAKTLIENVEKVISQKIENIVYIYSCWQPLYDDLLKSRNINFVEGIPPSLCDDDLPVNKNNLLIIDDLMNDASNNVEVQNVFTKYVHHVVNSGGRSQSTHRIAF